MSQRWKYEFVRGEQIVKGYGTAETEKELIDKLKLEENIKRKPKNFLAFKIKTKNQ